MADLLPLPFPPPPAAEPDDTGTRRLALDTTQSFLVEAPAGSGKTGLLIQRYLKLLAADGVTDPSQVLAITFTRKASIEMRDRVLAQLQAASIGTEPRTAFDRLTRPLAVAALEQDRRLGWKLLDDPRRLNLRTIDSISAEIARSLPVLSGAAGGLTPNEEPAPLYAQAARRTLMLLGGEDTALSQALEIVLLHRDANLDNCETLIAEMLQWRDQWGELIPVRVATLEDAWLDREILPRMQKALDDAICRGLTRLVDIISREFLQTLCELAADWSGLDGHPSDPSPIALCAGRSEPPEARSEDLDHWKALIGLLVTEGGDFRKDRGITKANLKFLLEKHHRDQLTQLIDQVRGDDDLRKTLCSIRQLPPAIYPADQWVVTKALFRVLSRALVELQLVFAETGQCDFAELALLARSALRKDSSLEDLNHATGLDLQHLLVDEMQDTSTSQYELIQLLTQGWDGRSQTVFLVGDPKQSIYLFRQARVERFVQTMLHGRLGELPLTPLQLTANFRSQAHLVDAFNSDFSQLFPPAPDPAQPEEVPYTQAQATREPGFGVNREWHTRALPFVEPGQEQTQERALIKTRQRTTDARTMRRIIQQWRARPLQSGRTEPWKIAILVRNRIHLQEIVAVLKQQPDPIPFRAVDIEALGTRQEILDLLALTRALLHPADRTAWLALLRTPWCGLGLADLHTLAGGDDETCLRLTVPQLLGTRGDLLSEDAIARLAPFYRIMREAESQRGRLPLARWVELTWRDFHADAFSTPEELANAESYFGLLEEVEQPGGRLDLGQLGKRLDRLWAAPSAEPNAVDLMTIHGSKGLEWDVVFVPALERLAPNFRGKLLSWMEVDSAGDLIDDPLPAGILAPIQSKGEAARQLNVWMRGIQTARENAERKRLFYVACTRAREELHLFAAPMRKKDGGFDLRNSLLASAWPAAAHKLDAPVITMPAPAALEVLPAIAATADESGPPKPPRIIERIPLAALAVFGAPTPDEGQSASFQLFTRPEGSFAARAFGNAVHAFLEQLALRRQRGESLEALTRELPSWLPRLTRTLRAGGLAPTQLDRQAAHLADALRNALSDPAGQWILSPHPEAAAELAVALASAGVIRLDRTFLAGPEPLSTGDTHRWVIDYKTATLGGRNLNHFLAEERAKYEPQMNSYRAALAAETRPIRLALYYPLLPALLCY